MLAKVSITEVFILRSKVERGFIRMLYKHPDKLMAFYI